MTYSEFTQQHIETLKRRMLDANLEIKPPRTNFPTPQDYLWNIEKQCEKAGLSIEAEPATVNIEIRGGIAHYQTSGDVVVTLTDHDNMHDESED